MFHSDKFIKRLETTPGCKAIGYNCGHWVQHYETKQVLLEIRGFVQ